MTWFFMDVLQWQSCNFFGNQMDRLFLDLAGNQVNCQGCSQIGEFTSLMSHSIEKPSLTDLTPMNWAQCWIVSKLDGTRCSLFYNYCAFNSHSAIAMIMKPSKNSYVVWIQVITESCKTEFEAEAANMRELNKICDG